jgi:transcriptional regulator with XRE-family HTH domain
MVPSDLIDQVKILTKERGARSALAVRLGVSRQRLNEWLSGRSKPSARYLLKLLPQVAAMNRRVRTSEAKQQKNAGSASTLPAQTTKKGKSTTHEKAKSVGKKK